MCVYVMFLSDSSLESDTVMLMLMVVFQDKKVLPKNLWSANLLPNFGDYYQEPLSDVLCQSHD
jgi:hypothetical protein